MIIFFSCSQSAYCVLTCLSTCRHTNSKKREKSGEAVGFRTPLKQPFQHEFPSGKTKINEAVHSVAGSIFMSSSVFVCVCMFQREKEPRGQPPALREQPHHSSTEKVSGPRTGQPSAGIDHSTPVSLSTDTTSQLFTSLRVPNNITKKNQKEGKEIRRKEGKRKGQEPGTCHTSLHRSSFPNKKTQQLDTEDQPVD